MSGSLIGCWRLRWHGGRWGASAAFQAPLTQTHPLLPSIQCPGTHTELGVGGSSQWAATHFHCPASKLQWPGIHTQAGNGGGPIIWLSATLGEFPGADVVRSRCLSQGRRHPAMQAAPARMNLILEFTASKVPGRKSPDVFWTDGARLVFQRSAPQKPMGLCACCNPLQMARRLLGQKVTGYRRNGKRAPRRRREPPTDILGPNDNAKVIQFLVGLTRRGVKAHQSHRPAHKGLLAERMDSSRWSVLSTETYSAVVAEQRHGLFMKKFYILTLFLGEHQPPPGCRSLASSNNPLRRN